MVAYKKDPIAKKLEIEKSTPKKLHTRGEEKPQRKPINEKKVIISVKNC